MTDFYNRIYVVDTTDGLIEYLKDLGIDLSNVDRTKVYDLLPELGIAVYDFLDDFIDDMWDEFEQMMSGSCNNLDDIIKYKLHS